MRSLILIAGAALALAACSATDDTPPENVALNDSEFDNVFVNEVEVRPIEDVNIHDKR